MRNPSPLTPLQHEVIRQFDQRVKNGEFQPGIYLPAENELAKLFMASRWTIRNIITYLITQGTLVRTNNGRLLLTSSIPQDVETPTLGTIFVWLRWKTSHRSGDFLLGLQDALSSEGVRIHCEGVYESEYSDETYENEEANFLKKALASESCRMIILWRHPRSELTELYREIESRNIALLFVEVEPPAGLRANHVGLDRAAGVAMVVRKAFENGHRKFLVLTGDVTLCPIAQKSLDSVQRTLSELRTLCPDFIDYKIESVVISSIGLTVIELAHPADDQKDGSRTVPESHPSAIINISPLLPRHFAAILDEAGINMKESTIVFQAHTEEAHGQRKSSAGIYWDYKLVGRRAGIRASKLLQSDIYPFVETVLILPEWIEGEETVQSLATGTKRSL